MPVARLNIRLFVFILSTGCMFGCGSPASTAHSSRPSMSTSAELSQPVAATMVSLPSSSSPISSQTPVHQSTSFLTPAPPPATLEVAGRTQTAGIGTYCWTEAERSLCADMAGIPTTPDPLVASVPLQARLRLPLATRPAALQFQIIPVSDGNAVPIGARGYRWWMFQDSERRALPLETEQTLDLNLEAGVYVLGFFVRWEQSGDVTYGFLLKVE